jgi:hypothetical protein
MGLDFDSVMDGIAGMQMSSPTSRGIMGKMSIGAGLTGTGAAVAGGIPFSALSILALTSPKLVSGVFGTLGWSNKQIRKFLNAPGVRQIKKGVTTTTGRAVTSNVGRYTDLINAGMDFDAGTSFSISPDKAKK